MGDFFNRDPKKVAIDLMGKQLEVNKKSCTITATLPRSRQDNIRWLDSKPLFGDSPVDVYVSPYRGCFLLFLRTKPDTCVRIEAIKFGDKEITGPGNVCKELGIAKERTGDVALDGEIIRVVWH